MIVIGGENLIDFVQTATEDGLPVYTAKPGGSCYNVAMAAARQGQDVVYVTPISNDSLGNVLAKRLLDDRVRFAAPRSKHCLLYTSPSPRDGLLSRMPASA